MSESPSIDRASVGATVRDGYAAAERPRTVARSLVQVAALVALAIGGVHVVLWLLGVPPRWSARGALTVKTNMALAQALAGAALLALTWRTPGPRRRALALVAAVGVLLLGALTLAEHLLGLDLHIDQLVAREPPGQPGVTSPNRMGPPGATSLTLIGLGLVALARRLRGASQLGAAVCCFQLVPTVGFLYGLGELHADAAVTAIAWPTVIALFSLGLALAVTEPEEGPVPLLLRDDPGGALLRRVLLPATVLPIVVGGLRLAGERAGLYGRNVGTGLFAITMAVLFAALLWRAAGRLSAAALDRRRVESAAREVLSASEERHRILARDRQLALDAARMGWWHYDPVTRLASFDARYQEIFGVTGHRRPNDEILKLLHPEDLPRVWAAVTAALDPAVAAPYSTQYRIIRPDGAVRWIEAHGVAAFVGDGAGRAATALVGTVEDVTDRREADEAVREANARLVEADRRKDEFLGMLSHELRNPLAPIRNALHVLGRADPGSPQARRALEIASRQVGHLTRLVDDLLDVTRVARGKIQLHRGAVDLAVVARRAADDHRPLLAERGLELAVRETGRPVPVVGDETRLAQVLGNLLHNAAKFTPEGGQVTLSVGVEDGLAALRVADTGPGIDPALLGELFSPFTQARQTLARTEGGLGLGLALVKAIVTLHGGEVRARSEGVGRGSEFVILLPLARAESAGAGAGAAAAAERGAP